MMNSKLSFKLSSPSNCVCFGLSVSFHNISGYVKFAICKPPLPIIIDEKLYLCQNDFHNLHNVTSLLYFTGLSINSTILSNIGSFLGNLSHFLAPAVGNTSRWLLCYRASTHGWAVKTFHDRCDLKLNTLTIIKNGQYLFGGYTDIAWGK